MNRKITNPAQIGGGSAVYFGSPIEVVLTGATHNLVIPDLETSTIVHIEATGNYTWTGLVPPDITLGWWFLVYNTGTNNITLKNNDANSTAQNRFLLGADKVLQSDEGLALVYDTDDLRWRSFGINI